MVFFVALHELHDYLMPTDKKKLNKIKKIIFYKAKSNKFNEFKLYRILNI